MIPSIVKELLLNESNKCSGKRCAYLAQGGVWIKYTKKDVPYIKKIMSHYILKTKDYNENIIHVLGYKHFTKEKILVMPKFRYYELLGSSTKSKYFRKLGLSEKTTINKLQLSSDFVFLRDKTKFHWSGRPKKYQELVIKKIFGESFDAENLKRGTAGAILNLPTGHGKTFVSIAIMAMLKLPTLIVCPRKKIADQWYNILKEQFPDVKIGCIHSGRKVNGDIMVGVVHSLTKMDKYVFKHRLVNPATGKKYTKTWEYSADTFFNRWDFVVLDECHNYFSDKMDIYRRVKSRYQLGLSATPDERRDKFDTISHWNIGPIVDAKHIQGYAEAYKREFGDCAFSGIVKGIHYHAPKEYSKLYMDYKERPDIDQILRQQIRDPYRTQLIINELGKLISKDYCVLVFSDRIDHLKYLQQYYVRAEVEKIKKNLQYVKERFGLSTKLKNIIKSYLLLKKSEYPTAPIILDELTGKSLQVLTGGANDAEMGEAERQTDVIFSTYQFMGEGVSIPRINAIIYATPRTNKLRQFNGRALRESKNKIAELRDQENKKPRIFVDIVDGNMEHLIRRWKKRKSTHGELSKITGGEFSIEESIANYKDIKLCKQLKEFQKNSMEKYNKYQEKKRKERMEKNKEKYRSVW